MTGISRPFPGVQQRDLELHLAQHRIGEIIVRCGTLDKGRGAADDLATVPLEQWGPFHFAAIVSGVTVLLGFIAAFWRWPKKTWVAGHAYWMAWSYVGLCAAAVSEVSTRYLHMNFGLTVGIATLVVVGIGSRIIKRHVPRILREDYGIS